MQKSKWTEPDTDGYSKLSKAIAYCFIALVLLGFGLMILLTNKPTPDSPYKTISIGGVVTLDIPCDSGGTVINTVRHSDWTELSSSCLAFQTVNTSLNVDVANIGYFSQDSAGRSYSRYINGTDGTNSNGAYYSISPDRTNAHIFAEDNSARLTISLQGTKPIIDIQRVVDSVNFK